MPKATPPNKFDLKRATLITKTLQAQHMDHHTKFAETNARRTTVIRAQNRIALVNESHNPLAASAHDPYEDPPYNAWQICNEYSVK